jgi:hypothetical protein
LFHIYNQFAKLNKFNVFKKNTSYRLYNVIID